MPGKQKTFANILIHTCTYQENLAVLNAAGEKGTPDWQNVATAPKPCLYEPHELVGDGNERTANKKTIIGDANLMAPASAFGLITTAMRVVNITVTETSADVDAGPFDIMQVNPVYNPKDGTLHHVEFKTERVYGG